MNPRPILSTGLLALAIACGSDGTSDPSGTRTAQLTVTFSAGGNGADADGFALQLDSVVRPAGVNTSLSWDSLPTGTHQLRLVGLAPQCRAEPDSQTISVAPDQDNSATFRVVCYGEIAYSGLTQAGIFQLFYLDADGTTRQLTDFPRSNFARGWSPDGNTILFTSADPVTYEEDVYTIRPDGTDLHQLTSGTTDDLEPHWSPDGSQIAFYRDPSVTQRAHTIQLMDADGSNEHAAFEGVIGDFDPVWVPGSADLIFSCSRYGHNWDLCRAGADGSGIGYIPGVLGLQYAVASPAGNGVAFMAWPTGKQSIFTMGWDGSGFRDLAPSVSSYDFRWSGNGLWFTLNTWDGTNFALRLVSRGPGGDAIQISDSAGASDWSPDNTLIAFDSWEGGGPTQIWVVRPDGTGKRRITDSPLSMIHPLWRPTARPGSARIRATRAVTWRATPTLAPKAPVRAPAGLARPALRADGCITLPGEEHRPCHPE